MIYFYHFLLTILSFIVSSGLCLFVISLFDDVGSSGTGALTGAFVAFIGLLVLWLVLMFGSSIIIINLLF